ncbi:retrovirus-related pol polyprotein from transposon TNT 1-94 [Tanacetum coccineum]
MSSIAKFDVEKIDGSMLTSGLWRGEDAGLKIVIQLTWTDVYKKAHSALLLCLDNKVLREVNKEDSAAGVWLKLETLYMTKSLANKLYLKKKMFTFYMHSGTHVTFHHYHLTYDKLGRVIADGLKRVAQFGRCKDHRDHLKKDCPKRNKKKSTGFVKKNAGQGSGMHSEGYDNGDLLMAVSEERFLEWIMDSGGSFHMTPRRDFLEGGGTIQMKDGSSFVLENVRYIPELKRNLISLGTLDREGYTMKLQNGRVKVIKGSLMVLSGTMKGNCVYSLDGWAESGEASVGIQKKESLAQVLHKRMGHISEAGLHELEKREVRGNKGLGKLEFCENCVLGKSTGVSFGRGLAHVRRGVLDLSMRISGNEAFSKFKEWKQLVENQTGRKLKKLRTDNGLEFCNQEFNNLCKESGIARHLTVAGTPQQNGLAERMNMTLLNKVRCLLIQSGLPDSFWAEATVTTTYLINRSPSTALEKKTPMDLWSGHPANYEMLRIFGCVAYSHVNQGKLKPRAIKCIFLGYPDGVKGYRLWRLDDVKPKIIISRDVVFNESLMYKDTLKGVGAADSRKEVEFEVELQGSSCIELLSEEGRDDVLEEESLLGAGFDQLLGQKLVSYKWLYKIKEWIEGVQKPSWIILDVRTASFFMVILNMRQPPGFEEGTGNKQLEFSRRKQLWKIAAFYCSGVCLVLKIEIIIPTAAANKSLIMKELGPDRKYNWYLANPVYGRDQGKHVDVDGFVDADYAKDPDKGRSITGYVFMVHGCVVSWKATLQHVVALSTTEAKEIYWRLLWSCLRKAIWLKGLLIELGVTEVISKL